MPAYVSYKIGKRSNARAYNLHYSEDLNLPECRTAAAQRGFFYRAAKAWNNLITTLELLNLYAKAELVKK